MILAIDTGNTHIVLGCIDEKGEISHIIRLETNLKKTEYEYASDIKQILELENVDRFAFTDAVISSSVPQLIETLRKAVKIISGIDAMVVGAGVKTGLDIVLDDPGTIAADLVATAVAAKNAYPLPCIIIDMGTATTLSVVDSKKNYRGGLILTGMKVAADALTARTAQLPKVNFEVPAHVIGTNTIDCLKSGILYSNASALDGIIDRIEEELGEKCTAVATGGLSELVVPLCRRKIILDNNLLIKGLAIIYRKNKK